MMQTQMGDLATLFGGGMNPDAGSMGTENTQDEYKKLLGVYQGNTQGVQDAQRGMQLGGGLLSAGLAFHPALALAGGLMAWKAKNSLKDAKDQRKESFESLVGHEDFGIMDLFGQQDKRGLGERFKGTLGSYR